MSFVFETIKMKVFFLVFGMNTLTISIRKERIFTAIFAFVEFYSNSIHSNFTKSFLTIYYTSLPIAYESIDLQIIFDYFGIWLPYKRPNIISKLQCILHENNFMRIWHHIWHSTNQKCKWVTDIFTFEIMKYSNLCIFSWVGDFTEGGIWKTIIYYQQKFQKGVFHETITAIISTDNPLLKSIKLSLERYNEKFKVKRNDVAKP